MSFIFEEKPTILTIISSDSEHFYWILEILNKKCDFFKIAHEESGLTEMTLPFTAEEIKHFLIFTTSYHDNIFDWYNDIEKLYTDNILKLKKYINKNVSTFMKVKKFNSELKEKYYDEIVEFTLFICKLCLDIVKICDYIMYKDGYTNLFLDRLWDMYYFDKLSLVQNIDKKEGWTMPRWDNSKIVLEEMYALMLKSHRHCIHIFSEGLRKDINKFGTEMSWWRYDV